MLIRPYRETDFSALCQIFLSAVRETACQHYSASQIAAWAQIDETRWRQKMADSLVLVATVSHRPVGFVTAVGTYIDLLFVDPAYSRQGIASALLRELFLQTPAGTLTVEQALRRKRVLSDRDFGWLQNKRLKPAGSDL